MLYVHIHIFIMLGIHHTNHIDYSVYFFSLLFAIKQTYSLNHLVRRMQELQRNSPVNTQQKPQKIALHLVKHYVFLFQALKTRSSFLLKIWKFGNGKGCYLLHHQTCCYPAGILKSFLPHVQMCLIDRRCLLKQQKIFFLPLIP